ncbi:MAG: protein phosphatase 2C domain-containing protein, partial [Gemmatales bacterium]|nr:protein phosphatase 2C domain-containing protein [Gemmatales bacterium]MDW8175428.1 protein phosphatase 2C domain-containing protein [Gemmatales bacterium]
MQVRHFWVQKEGNAPEECEDAFAWLQEAQQTRVAMADGATGSAFARQWADILVQGFTHEWQIPKTTNKRAWLACWRDWLARQQQKWYERIAKDAAKLPWYGQRQVQQGSFAAFLGLLLCPKLGPDVAEPANSFAKRIHQACIQGDYDGYWVSFAVGDVCLFQLRDGQVRRVTPLARVEEITDMPTLVCSHPKGEENSVVPPTWKISGYYSGDVFLLATDALAAYLLQQSQQGHDFWQEMRRSFLDKPEAKQWAAFQEWVNELRALCYIKN